MLELLRISVQKKQNTMFSTCNAKQKAKFITIFVLNIIAVMDIAQKKNIPFH